MQEGKRMPCQDFCGTVPVDGRLHSKACHASPEHCYGERYGGIRIAGTPCRCSPGCQDAGRRLGDAVVARPARPEPSQSTTVVIDGRCWLGHIPARPFHVEVGAKPMAVAVGQRWRNMRVSYTVTEQALDRWLVRCDDGVKLDVSTDYILEGTYLGTVPAPESACGECGEPTYPCADCGKPRTKAEGGTTFTVCDACWDKHHGKSAAAPGAGELAFANAMALDPGEVEWTCDTLESHAWSSLALFQHLSLEYLRRCRFRLKPAPRPSLVREIAESADDGTSTVVLCERVAKAAIEAVRRCGGDLDRAEAELLQERP